MKFSFIQFYLIPGKNFEFTYRLQHIIPREVNKIFSKGKILSKSDWDFTFVVSCSNLKKDFIIKGPDIAKRTRTKSYGFYFSYNKVKSNKEPVLIFVELLFEGIKSLNNKEYIIDVDKLEEVKKSIQKKIAENPKDFYDNE